jgi:peptidoglycan/LPS O-acetylase OafA/YrhL
VTTREYWPQLDGVRAVAISAVIAYHLGYLPGGWVGVDIFFVLSGYLITTILMSHGGSWRRLSSFWGGRARRLLPAVLVLLLALSVYAWAKGPGLVPAQLRTPALATLFYSANWQEIHAGSSYFAQFTAPSPLQHMWSLAVEEQYYVVWPLLLGLLLLATRSRWVRHQQRALVLSVGILALLSAAWMGVAANIYNPNRAYLGTDSRAWELLLGGAAALLWPPGTPVSRRRTWSVLTALGVAGVIAGAWWSGGPPWWVWDGGLVGFAVCAGLVIVGGIRAPDSPFARLLALGPVRWVGLISYSLYLWHWPVIVLMTQDSTGLSGAGLLMVRLAAMVAAACASFYLIERPLRRADWRRLRGRLHVPAPSFALAGLCVTAVLIVGATVGPQRAPSAEVSLPASATRPDPPAASPASPVTPASAASAAPTATATSLLDLPPASTANPYRVWILGDSVMNDASLGVQAALQATGEMSVVLNNAFPGWGLTTDPGWPARAPHLIATYHPQIVIGTWSWDDTEAADTPSLYEQRLQAALRILLTPGDGVQAVILLQFPQQGPATEISNVSARNAAWVHQTTVQDDWNAEAHQAATAFPGQALYLTTSQLFAPDGRFYTWFRTPTGQWVRARKLDNTHFCPYGAAEFGAFITQDLTPELHLSPMKPGWEFGAWTHAPRYNDPPGACPADQPPPGYQGLAVPKTASSPST